MSKQAYRPLRLGKQAPRIDRRTLRIADIMVDRELPTIPEVYDFDVAHPGVDTPMFCNDRFGCCVISERAHQTRRFELVEQGVVIAIADDDVKTGYLDETGGYDNGLVMLESLNRWRKGWRAAGRQYSIDAFGSVPRNDLDRVRACIYLLSGMPVGLKMPKFAMDQTQQGEVWDELEWPSSWAPWLNLSVGGHCVLIKKYDAKQGLFTCITWGQEQTMTEKFFQKRCDEAYAVVDNTDAWLSKPGIDVAALERYMSAIAAA